MERVPQHPPQNVPYVFDGAGRERLTVALAGRLANQGGQQCLAGGGGDGSDGGAAERGEYVRPQQPVVLIHRALLELPLRHLQPLGFEPAPRVEPKRQLPRLALLRQSRRAGGVAGGVEFVATGFCGLPRRVGLAACPGRAGRQPEVVAHGLAPDNRIRSYRLAVALLLGLIRPYVRHRYSLVWSHGFSLASTRGGQPHN
ncbi:Uncharacterised protein [Mycobacteroides abscessus subsp. abscessus]|nr:Uncharacterised protein [Mycobacteroides abscessus subsp. abscessus]